MADRICCPKCGATSGKDGFGKETNRVSGGYQVELSQNKDLVKRREKARAISKHNKQK